MDREKVGLRDLLKTRALVIDMSSGRILVDINTGDITNSQTDSMQQAARERGLINGPFGLSQEMKTRSNFATWPNNC